MSNLTSEQKVVLRSVLTNEGLPADQVERIVRSLDEKMPASSVSVTQTTQVVERGATVIGYTARDI